MTVYQFQQSAWPQPTQGILPSYLYQEYADDAALQAFVDSYNTLAQSYLTWFNSTPLAVYTSPQIAGSLLDWIGQGIYGYPRPVISTLSTIHRAGYAENAYDTIAYNALSYSASGSAFPAGDDIYKRCLTWHLYRGDGMQFSIPWLKNRVARFLYGTNGTDAPVLDTPPSVTVSGGTFTITVPPSFTATFFQQLVAQGALALPFSNSFTVVT